MPAFVVFKIEGRPEDTGIRGQHHSALSRSDDTVMAGRPVAFTKATDSADEQSFSRGFSPGWLEGCDHKRLVRQPVRRSEACCWGSSRRFSRIALPLNSSTPSRRATALCLTATAWLVEEQGGRVFQVFPRIAGADGTNDSGVVELTFDRSHLDLSQLYVGQRIWKTDDPR